MTEYKPYNPLILRFHRLIEAFSKSDDERDFYLDRFEGFLVYVDLDKSQEELDAATKELLGNPNRYLLLPKMTFYEVKKLMEGFVNEKIYDIDIKEKLLEIIQSKQARENFLEFIYDHLSELDKWQQYYKDRSRVRIIEWLRSHDIRFVFEEDVDGIPVGTMEKIRLLAFDAKAGKEVQAAREQLIQKAGTYYALEATFLKPRRGRPPKQVQKVDVEVTLSSDIYTKLPTILRPFLFATEPGSSATIFSSKFHSDADPSSLRGVAKGKIDTKLEVLSQRLESLRQLSDRFAGQKQRALFGPALAEIEQSVEKESQPASSEKLQGAQALTGLNKLSSLFQAVLPKKGKGASKEKEPAEKKKTKRVTPIYKNKNE